MHSLPVNCFKISVFEYESKLFFKTVSSNDCKNPHVLVMVMNLIGHRCLEIDCNFNITERCWIDLSWFIVYCIILQFTTIVDKQIILRKSR